MNLDENGCPTEMNESGSCAKECPPTACVFCPSGSPVGWDGTNFEWCQEMKTCAATIDWEKVYDRD